MSGFHEGSNLLLCVPPPSAVAFARIGAVLGVV
jgi:hypothetical protein